MKIISTMNAQHYNWGQGCDGWHLIKHPDLSIIHERMPPGTAEVRHYHQQAWQFFFVLSGTATLELADQIQILKHHESIEVPPGLPHLIRNESDQELEFLVFSIPPSHGDRVVVENS